MIDGREGVLLQVITPEEMFFSGQVDMGIATCRDGQEGFMANHAWCVKLLADEGTLKIRRHGEKDLLRARVKGGHVDIKERFVIYTDEAEWEEDIRK